MREVEGVRPFADRTEAAACREGNVYAIQAKTDEIGLSIAIDIADCANILTDCPTMGQIKFACPLASRSKATACRQSHIDPIQAKADQVSPAIAVDIADCANILTDCPTMGQIKCACPLASRSKATACRQSHIDPIQAKADQVIPAITVDIANRADILTHRPTMG